MVEDTRKTERRDTRLAVDIAIHERLSGALQLERATGVVLDASAGGLKVMLLVGPEAAKRLESALVANVTAKLVVHLPPKAHVALECDVRWMRPANDSTWHVGLSFNGAHPLQEQKVVAAAARLAAANWPRPTVALPALAAAVILVGIGVGVVMNRQRATEGDGAPKAPGERAQARAASVVAISHATSPEAVQQVAQLDRLPPPPKLSASLQHPETLPAKKRARLDAFLNEPRDEIWAGRSEKLFWADAQQRVATMSDVQARLWEARVDGLECRSTKCLLQVTAKGPGQYLSFFEERVLTQGELLPDRFAFKMRCRPISMHAPHEGELPAAEPNGYTTSVLFDCADPVHASLPPPPDRSKDRLLNPALRDTLPESVRANADQLAAQAEVQYQAQLADYERQKASRDNPDFRRVEPF